MSQERAYPPLTAYEALLSFFPDHSGHTVMKARFPPADHLEMECNCGANLLVVTGKMAAVLSWELRDVKYALRNVTVLK